MEITNPSGTIVPETVFTLGSTFLDRGTIIRTAEPVREKVLFMVESTKVSISPLGRESLGVHARNVTLKEGRFSLSDWGVWMEPGTQVELIAQVDPNTMAEIEQRITVIADQQETNSCQD